MPGALGVLAVQLADFEANGLRVGAHGVTGLVETGADRDDTTERPPAPGHCRHPLVVDPVLEVHDDAVRPGQMRQHQRRRPLGVVRFHRYERGVERLGDRLQLVHVNGLHADDVIATRSGQPQPLPAHRFHVLRPLVNQRDVAARLRQHAADHTADRPCANDCNSHHEPSPGWLTGL